MTYKRDRSRLLYWVILIGAALMYAVLALSDNIWADEAYTFAMLRHSFGEIWNITAADVHPPLYYFAAKVFTFAFGHSEYALRCFSGIFYLAILAIGGSQIGKLFDRRTGVCFMVLFLLYPFAFQYATEVRMYSLAALAVFLNALFAYRIWIGNRAGDWIGFTLAGVCAAYTHYFALVSAGIIYGLLFLAIVFRNRKLLKPWIAAALVTVALYLPWLKCFIEQLAYKVNNEYWIEHITVSTLIGYVQALLHANGFGAFPLYFGLLLVLLLVAQLRMGAWPSLLALAVPVLTVLLGVGVSIAVRPIFVIRYLAPCAPLLIFFLAYGIAQFRKESWFGAVLAVLLVAFSANAIYAFTVIRPRLNKLDDAFAARTADAEAFVVTAQSSLHISQVLSYYQPVTPIYVPDKLGADNPYPNKFELTEFSDDGMSSYIVMTDVGMEPDPYFADGFRTACIGTFFDTDNHVDVWVLTRE